MSTAFGCTIQGEVKHSEVLRLLQALLDAGCDRVSLADTVGYADPAAVQSLFEAARKVAGDKLWAGHFHLSLIQIPEPKRLRRNPSAFFTYKNKI